MKKSPRSKLTIKQEAVIADVIRSVKDGEKMSVAKSVERIYETKNIGSARTLATRNLNNDDFREALLFALEDRKILGADSEVEEVLASGLKAESKGEIDYRTRLEYVKEINKVAGMYAPERRESHNIKLNLNMTKEELDKKIRLLKEELKV